MLQYGFDKVKNTFPKKLTEKMFVKWRTGLSPANPKGALLLVKEIDRLQAERNELRREVAQLKSHRKYWESE